MTQEEIIEMARQAGFERLGHDNYYYVCYPDDIEFFAKLVAKRTWVGLTDEEVNDLYNEGMGIHATIAATEAKLEDKNT